MQLYPIQIQTDGPVAYTVAPEVATAMTSNNSSDNQVFRILRLCVFCLILLFVHYFIRIFLLKNVVDLVWGYFH